MVRRQQKENKRFFFKCYFSQPVIKLRLTRMQKTNQSLTVYRNFCHTIKIFLNGTLMYADDTTSLGHGV